MSPLCLYVYLPFSSTDPIFYALYRASEKLRYTTTYRPIDEDCYDVWYDHPTKALQVNEAGIQRAVTSSAFVSTHGKMENGRKQRSVSTEKKRTMLDLPSNALADENYCRAKRPNTLTTTEQTIATRTSSHDSKFSRRIVENNTKWASTDLTLA